MALYGLPTWPSGKAAVVMLRDARTVNGSVALAERGGLPASCACSVSVTALAPSTGVPLMAPLVPLSSSPGGSVPAVSDQVYGGVPPLAASSTLYASPTWASGSALVVIDSAAGGGGSPEPPEPPPEQAVSSSATRDASVARSVLRMLEVTIDQFPRSPWSCALRRVGTATPHPLLDILTRLQPHTARIARHRRSERIIAVT